MKGLLQFIKFGIVGVANTFISEGVYALVVLLGGHYILANFLGFTISVLNAYYWSNKYVFKAGEGTEKRVWWKVLLKTYAAYIWGFLVNILLLALWVEVIHIGTYMVPVESFLNGFGITFLDAETIGELVAQMLCLPVTVPMNYFVNKYWAYRDKKKKPAEESAAS